MSDSFNSQGSQEQEQGSIQHQFSSQGSNSILSPLTVNSRVTNATVGKNQLQSTKDIFDCTLYHRKMDILIESKKVQDEMLNSLDGDVHLFKKAKYGDSNSGCVSIYYI